MSTTIVPTSPAAATSRPAPGSRSRCCRRRRCRRPVRRRAAAPPARRPTRARAYRRCACATAFRRVTRRTAAASTRPRWRRSRASSASTSTSKAERCDRAAFRAAPACVSARVSPPTSPYNIRRLSPGTCVHRHSLALQCRSSTERGRGADLGGVCVPATAKLLTHARASAGAWGRAPRASPRPPRGTVARPTRGHPGPGAACPNC